MATNILFYINVIVFSVNNYFKCGHKLNFVNCGLTNFFKINKMYTFLQ